MDNVLVDFPSGIEQISKEKQLEYDGRLDEVPGIFALMKPLRGALEAFRKLSQKYDTYILSTAPWRNSSGWSDKNEWVKTYLGDVAHKRLILSHQKNLNIGGLMCIPPINSDAKFYFNKMREIKSKLNDKLLLSMGMSNDYLAALECGSNLIRVGSKIFI